MEGGGRLIINFAYQYLASCLSYVFGLHAGVRDQSISMPVANEYVEVLFQKTLVFMLERTIQTGTEISTQIGTMCPLPTEQGTIQSDDLRPL